MNIHAPSDSVYVRPSLRPETRTTTGTGTEVDTRGYTRALVVFHVGDHENILGDGDETLDVKLQESSDSGVADAWADVPGGAFNQLAAVAPTSNRGWTFLMNVDLAHRERYLRAVGTPDGTTPSTTYSVIFILFNPWLSAPAQDLTVISV